MDVRDPVPTVSIPVTVGKRTIMVPLSTPEECAALIALVCAARKMIDAATAAHLADLQRQACLVYARRTRVVLMSAHVP